MSQYGAAGYAEHGYNYRAILERYYSQTTIAATDPDRVVTVLLKPGGSPSFSGATRVSGTRQKLNPSTHYSVRAVGPRLRVFAGTKPVGTFSAPLRVSGARPLTLIGAGVYRGAFLFRPTGKGGVMTVNSVGLDDYVRGVVGAEMPTAWPAQALEAQAVAARTYAITDGQIQADFDVYDDTRSQMYEGVKAETAATNAAVAATRGQIVDYDGRPVTTYFFASSGGETESVQNVFAGISPESWLVSEADPYDDSYHNPYYRWNLNLTLQAARRKLGKFVEGSLDGVKVLTHGVSPRIVQARIVGSQGSATVTGEQLEADLGTPSTWMSLTTISATGSETTTTLKNTPKTPARTTTTKSSTTDSTPATTETNPPAVTDTNPTGGGTVSAPVVTTDAPAGTGSSPPSSGGVGTAARASGAVASPARLKISYKVHGTIFPATSGAKVVAQRHNIDGWATVGSSAEEGSGAYTITVPAPGLYRVRYGTVIGPQIQVR